MGPVRTLLRVIGDVRTTIAAESPLPTLRRAMYTQLGDIAFEVVGPVTGLEMKRGYTYARHEIIEGKPRLEAIGDELDVLTFSLDFLREIADPVTSYADLCAAAAAHVALPLIFANGQVMGHFVITSIDDAVDLTDGRGSVLKRRTRVELTEWVESKPLEVTSRARRAAATANSAAAPKVAKKQPPVHADPASVPMSVVIRGR
ncbi:MAG: phage tail protein [Gemmatimonadaceae bacterium]